MAEQLERLTKRLSSKLKQILGLNSTLSGKKRKRDEVLDKSEDDEAEAIDFD